MFQISIAMAKQVYECNWAPSRVTEEHLNNLVKTESDNGNSTMMNALAVQQGTNGIYRVIILSVKLNRLIWH